MPGMPRGQHELHFHFSTMGGGKTAEILLDEYRRRHSGWNTLIAKPAIDLKAGANIQSRIAGGIEMPAILISPEQDASEVLRKQMAARLGQTAVWENPWLVYVDEAQFLEPRQVQQLAHTIVDSNIATV